MGKLLIKEIDRELAKDIIIKNHYSHKWNTAFGKVNVGIFQCGNDKCLGVASFGNLMNPKSFKQFNKDFTQDNIIELNRLWIDDCLGKNAETILLGASWKIIRQNYPNIKAVQSFADGRLGCGTIYKASNFDYYGYTESLFYENIDTGEAQHKVPMENTMRPDGMIKLNVLFAQNKLKPFFVKTYKYIYPLYKNVKIELSRQKYPEYDKGIIECNSYQHRKGLVVRAMMLAYILEQDDDYIILKDYIDKNLNDNEKSIEYYNSYINDSIIRIATQRKMLDRYNSLKELLLIKKVDENCTCGGKIVKLKSGRTCQDCFKDY